MAGPTALVQSSFQNQPTIGGGINTSGKQPAANLMLKRPFLPKGLQNVQQAIPATNTFVGTANQTGASSTVTVTAVTSGTLGVGSILSGPGVTAGTTVTAVLTGTGGVGTYTVNNTVGFASAVITAVGSAAPVLAISTVNPLAAGQFFAATNNSGNVNSQYVDLSQFAISATANPIVSGPTNPDPAYVAWMSVSAGTGVNVGGYNGANMVKIRVNFISPALQPILVLQCKGIAGQLSVKVNDQYASLAPVTIPNNGTANYVSLTFPGPLTDAVTVEFIADDVLNQFRFAGMWTLTGDTLSPAQIRGPRVIVMGDSFTTATGAGGLAYGFVNVFAEYMGWDDVWPSGIGGTGLINPGTAVNYQQRVQNDVIAFAPDEVIIQGFFNDGSNTGAQVGAALTALINTIQASLPATRITVVGPYIVNGSGYQFGTSSPSSTGIVSQRTALAAAVAAIGSSLVHYIDPSSFGPVSSTPLTGTITAKVNAGATSFVSNGTNITAGKTVQWPDGSRSFIISVAGFTATVDNIQNQQNAGTVFTECPGCYLRGNGHVGATTGVGNADTLVFTDGIHPSATGHIVLGTMFAQAYANLLNSVS
jgi:lysophospholipase L1-like esterase